MTQAKTQEKVQEIVKDLKSKYPKFRITEPRKAILTYMIDTDRHPTAEEIYQYLKQDFKSISLATIYNSLHFLVEAGYLYELTQAGSGTRYDFVGDRHYHMICKRCGRVDDFYYHDIHVINQAAIDQTGYQIQQTKIELYGLCPQCQQDLAEQERDA